MHRFNAFDTLDIYYLQTYDLASKLLNVSVALKE